MAVSRQPSAKKHCGECMCYPMCLSLWGPLSESRKEGPEDAEDAESGVLRLNQDNPPIRNTPAKTPLIMGVRGRETEFPPTEICRGWEFPKVGDRNSLLPRRWGVRCFSCRQGEAVGPALLGWLFDADSDVLGAFELDAVNGVSCFERVLQCGFVCFDGDALVVVW